MDEPLLPCPFCGSDTVKAAEPPNYRARNYHVASCQECCADAPLTEWNNRAGLSPIARTDLEKLRDDMRFFGKGFVSFGTFSGAPDAPNQISEWATRLDSVLGAESTKEAQG